jgi:DHA1 family multidrug resistance protein-like MFS transporter
VGALIYLPSLQKYKHLIVEWDGNPPPEERLPGALIGAPLLVLGSFWLGWAGQYEQVPWYVAGLATIVLGTAFNLLFFSL